VRPQIYCIELMYRIIQFIQCYSFKINLEKMYIATEHCTKLACEQVCVSITLHYVSGKAVKKIPFRSVPDSLQGHSSISIPLMCVISNVGKTYIVLGTDYNFIILIK